MTIVKQAKKIRADMIAVTATLTDEQLTGTPVPTYPWHTDITQTGDIKTTIMANAKVMEQF